jgi:hypothetical protein
VGIFCRAREYFGALPGGIFRYLRSRGDNKGTILEMKMLQGRARHCEGYLKACSLRRSLIRASFPRFALSTGDDARPASQRFNKMQTVDLRPAFCRVHPTTEQQVRVFPIESQVRVVGNLPSSAYAVTSEKEGPWSEQRDLF